MQYIYVIEPLARYMKGEGLLLASEGRLRLANLDRLDLVLTAERVDVLHA